MIDYAKILDGLDENERIYVESRLRGMSKAAALRAAGFKGGKVDEEIDSRPHIHKAFQEAHALSAHEVGVTREKVGEMLMDAYKNATNAAEQIMAARELGRLYGLYSPEKVEVAHRLEQVTSQGDLRNLPYEDLVKLAQLEKGITLEGEFEEIKVPVPLQVPLAAEG